MTNGQTDMGCELRVDAFLSCCVVSRKTQLSITLHCRMAFLISSHVTISYRVVITHTLTGQQQADGQAAAALGRRDQRAEQAGADAAAFLLCVSVRSAGRVPDREGSARLDQELFRVRVSAVVVVVLVLVLVLVVAKTLIAIFVFVGGGFIRRSCC